MTLDQAINDLARDLGRVLHSVLFEIPEIPETERARIAAFFAPVIDPIEGAIEAVEGAVEKVGRIERRSREVVEAIEELLEELFGG